MAPHLQEEVHLLLQPLLRGAALDLGAHLDQVRAPPDVFLHGMSESVELAFCLPIAAAPRECSWLMHALRMRGC